MKKILLVNKYYHPDIGGVETVVQQHAQLLKYEYSVTVLCISKEFSWYTKNEFINGVKVIRCSSLGTYFSMPLSITFFLHYFINYLKSDVIINHVPFPLMDLAFFIIDRLVKRKNILFWHSDIVKQKALKKILRPFIINTINRSTQILTTSPNLKANSEDIGEYQKKTDVLPLFINSNVINGYIKNLNAEKKYDFIFFGRLCYYKGVDILLDAVKILKNKGAEPEIFMAGDGDLVNYIENEIIENKIKNITFIKRFLTEEEKYHYLSISKCFLFPSVAASEAFGITQLEAMSLGLPVINTNLNTGVPFVSLNGVTGITVTAGNPDDLANAMLSLLRDDEKYESFKTNCKVRVSELFEENVVKNKLFKVIEELN